jgi:L-histidine Nalpha-methyltransferase
MPFDFKNLRPDNNSNSEFHEFAQAVIKGLSKERKKLPSWLIFDSRGSEIFKEITKLEDHHPSVCEFEIFNTHKQTIADILSEESIQLIDLGAGDGAKPRILLEQFLKNGMKAHYAPIDISEGAIKNLVATLEEKFSGTSIEVTGLAADYFQGLETLTHDRMKRNLVLFLGATIGNQDYPSAGKFLRRLWDFLNDGDYVMIGFDLMKNPKLLYRAYNDPEGVFQKFNLYMLDRINQELGANFAKSNFVQEAHYNARSHAVESHVYSIKEQTVQISELDKEFHFKAWEGMQTEQSYKFTMREIEELAHDNGFEIVEYLFDSRKFYVNPIWRVKK